MIPAEEFTLGGRTWHLRSIEDVSHAYIRSVRQQEEAGQDVLLVAEPFFRAALLPDEAEDFAALLNDPTGIVSLRKITEIMEWAYEVLSGGRPTQPPQPSSAGRTRTGKNSAAGSSSPGTRRKRSTG